MPLVSWTTPRTWADEELVTAALLNTHVRDNLSHLNEMKSPVGAIAIYAGASAPTGWLLCDGSAVSRTTYADLFALIGTTYGVGNGSSTFNVPDLRGRFLLGKDNMGGTSANRVNATEADNLGQGSGAETHTLITNELPTTNAGVRYITAGGGVNAAVDRRTDASTYAYDPNLMAAGGQAHNNMPPYLTLNFIIKW